MGINFELATFLDDVAEKTGIPGPTLGLGSLSLNVSEAELDAYAKRYQYPRLAAERTLRALFAERWGVADYRDCDINDLADLRLDLTQPIPADLRGAFGSVVNAGTLEHVFDFRRAMTNVHELVRVGGVMIHTAPTTFFEHGFFNLNPLLFDLVAEANAYETISTGFYFSPGTVEGLHGPSVFVHGRDELIPGTEVLLKEAMSPPHLPAKTAYLVAQRKTREAPFEIPSQVSY